MNRISLRHDFMVEVISRYFNLSSNGITEGSFEICSVLILVLLLLLLC